ncbi:MAG: hypothetical protein ACTS3R_15260 [Inquilinaceae bacterium]
MIRRALTSIGNAARSLFGGRPEPQPEVSAARQKRWRESFEHRAKALLNQRDGQEMATGAIQLFGLNGIRAELGSDWDRVANRAYEVAQAIIRRHLGDDDVFERRDNETFVLCFADLTLAQAKILVQRMSEELKAALRREVPQAASVNVAQHVTALTPGDDDGDSSVLDRVARSLEQITQTAEQTFERRRNALFAQANVIYSPICDQRKQTIVMNRCLLDDTSSRQPLENLLSLAEGPKVVKVLADIDGFLLGCAIRDLHTLLQVNDRVMFVVPVNFYTLKVPATRDAFVALCQKMPEAYRQYVMFEITGVPPKTTASRLANPIESILPYGYGVIVEMPPGGMAIGELVSIGAFGVSITLPSGAESFDDAAMTSLNTAFALGLRTMVHGIGTAGLIQAAIDAGLYYLDGNAVAPKTDTPKGARKLKLAAKLDQDGDPLSLNNQANERITA